MCEWEGKGMGEGECESCLVMHCITYPSMLLSKVVVHEVELYTATKTFCESRGIGTTFAAAEFDKQECPLTSWGEQRINKNERDTNSIN